jgi:hypothetical protein
MIGSIAAVSLTVIAAIAVAAANLCLTDQRYW